MLYLMNTYLSEIELLPVSVSVTVTVTASFCGTVTRKMR
jgi:hypothetical protein